MVLVWVAVGLWMQVRRGEIDIRVSGVAQPELTPEERAKAMLAAADEFVELQRSPYDIPQILTGFSKYNPEIGVVTSTSYPLQYITEAEKIYLTNIFERRFKQEAFCNDHDLEIDPYQWYDIADLLDLKARTI
jgi:hypothetical protein